MPQCLKCGTELQVNEEGVAPVLCDRCAGVATSRARRGMSTGTLWDFPATTILVGINVAVLVAMMATAGSAGIFSPQNPVVALGENWGPMTYSGQYWRLITSAFIHGSFMHIAFNMWCLWSLGQLSEKLFGSWITAGVYLLTGVGGSLLSIFVHPTNAEVGASGAIFGIAGAALSGVKFGNVSVSSWQKRSITSSLIFFAGFNLLLGANIPGIDNWCHLGGLITGLIFGVPLATASVSGKKSMEWLTMLLAGLVLAVIGSRVIAPKAHESRLGVSALYIREHNYPAAIRLLERDTASSSDDGQAFALLGYAYEHNGDRDKAIEAFRRAVQLNPNDQILRQELQQLEATKPLQQNSPNDPTHK